MNHRFPIAAALVPSAAVLSLALVVAAGVRGPALGQEQPGGPEASSGATAVRGEALPGGAPEIAGYKEKLVFVLDRSGSMAVADRFFTALDIIDQLLVEMSKDTMFDIYLADHGTKSLFDGNWMRPSQDMRDNVRKRITAAGGLDYGGFTDISGALREVANKRRPDAIYLLTDGVATLEEVDTPAIIASVVKAAKNAKVPIHTIGIGLGLDPAEDGDEAAALLKGISEGTGGIAREVKSKKRHIPRAFRLPLVTAPPPPEELARFHLKFGGSAQEKNSRVIAMETNVGIEIEDPTFRLGSVPLEYSDPKLFVRTYLTNGRLFVESRPIAVMRKGDRLVAANPLAFVDPTTESTQDQLNSKGAIEIKCPREGSVEFIYKRGAREFREAALVSPPPPRGRER